MADGIDAARVGNVGTGIAAELPRRYVVHVLDQAAEAAARNVCAIRAGDIRDRVGVVAESSHRRLVATHAVQHERRGFITIGGTTQPRRGGRHVGLVGGGLRQQRELDAILRRALRPHVEKPVTQCANRHVQAGRITIAWTIGERESTLCVAEHGKGGGARLPGRRHGDGRAGNSTAIEVGEGTRQAVSLRCRA
jgi:hypothetical protein